MASASAENGNSLSKWALAAVLSAILGLASLGAVSVKATADSAESKAQQALTDQAGMKAKLDAVDQRVVAVDGKVEKLDGKMDQIIRMQIDRGGRR